MSMFPVLHRYDEVFKIEIEGWCFGIANYPGEVAPSILHRIIRELSSSFQAAIEHNVVFNIVEISDRLVDAARLVVHPKEVALAIVAQLPNPSILSEEQQCVLGHIIDKVEQVHPGALDSFYRRWNLSVRDAA